MHQYFENCPSNFLRNFAINFFCCIADIIFFCNFVFANHWNFCFWHILPMSKVIILIFSFSEVGKQQFLDAGGLDKLKEFCTKSIFDDKRWDRLLYRACTGKTFSLILYFIYLHIIYIFYKIYFFQFFAKFVMLNRFL